MTEPSLPYDESACIASDGTGFAAWTEKVGLLARSQIFFGELTGERPHVELARPLASGGGDHQRFPQLSCKGPIPSIIWGEESLGSSLVALQFWQLDSSMAPTTVAANVRATTRFSYDWSGSNYLIGYTESGGRVVTSSLDPYSRIAGLPRPIADDPAPDGFGDVWIRSGGSTPLALWHVLYPQPCQITCPPPTPRFRARTLSKVGDPISPVLELRQHYFGYEEHPSFEWDGSNYLLLSLRDPDVLRVPSLTIISPAGVEVGKRELPHGAGPPATLFVRPAFIAALSFARVFPGGHTSVVESRFSREYIAAGGRTAHRFLFHPRSEAVSAIRAASGPMHFIIRDRSASGIPSLYVHTLSEETVPRRRPDRGR